MKLGINEELWYGDDAGEEAEKRAAKSMAARMGRIIGTKPFPVAAQRLTVLTQNPDCSMDEVVTVLESDPALSARLLRLVNSAGFALRTACTSVRHAATLVGTEKLNQIASTAAILDMYGKSGVHAAVILEHATAVGALCRYLAFHFSLPPDDLFTCGFLHDIGKLMMIETEGEEYVELLKKHAEFDTAYVVERERYGFDHALLAGHVLSAWNIPHPVPKVVAWHHHITRAYAESTLISQMVSTLRLADAMSFAFEEPDQKLAIERLGRMEAASYMDISEAQIAAMWDEVKALTERARAIFRGEDPPEVTAPAEVIQTGKPSQQSLRAVASGRQSLRASAEPAAGSSRRAPASSVRAADSLDPGPVSIRPGTGSLRAGADSEPQTPRQFPCVVCEAPSFAQTCAACRGYVCPMHVGGEDEWCQLCQDAYRDTGIPAVGPGLSVVLGAGLGILVAAAFFGAASAGAQQPLRLMFGPTLVMSLLGMLVGFGQRWVRRWWFLRSRPNRSLDQRRTVTELLSLAQQPPLIVEIQGDATASDGASPEHTPEEPARRDEAPREAKPREIEREPDLSPRATRSAELGSASLPPPPKAERRSSAAPRGGKRLDNPLPKIPAAPALPGPDILPPVLSTPPPPSNRNKQWMSKSPLTGSPESTRDSLPPSSPRPSADASLEPQPEAHEPPAHEQSPRASAPPPRASDASGLVRASELARDAGASPLQHTQRGTPPPAAIAEAESATPITLPSQPPPPPSDREPATRVDGRKSAPSPARGARHESAPLPAPAQVPSRLNDIPAPVPIAGAFAVGPALAHTDAALSADGACPPASSWTDVLDSHGTADGW